MSVNGELAVNKAVLVSRYHYHTTMVCGRLGISSFKVGCTLGCLVKSKLVQATLIMFFELNILEVILVLNL